jgi:hypothetical protein
MTKEPILESGMRFGGYPERHCFHIEKSDLYQKNREDVKIAEFLLYRGIKNDQPIVWIIEAKSSSPKVGNQPNFDNFIQEIQEKFFNTLLLYISIKLKRHNIPSQFSNIFQDIDLKKTSFCFILIIKGHQEAWLPPLQDALKKALKPLTKIWNLSPTAVVVLNDTLAQERGLIQVDE